MGRQLCRPQINGLAGRPVYGLPKDVDGPGNLSVITTGNRCPAVRSHPIRCAAEMYAVTGRDAQIAGQSRSANPTSTSLEAQSALKDRNLKIKPLDAWDFWICNHNINAEAVALTQRNKIQQSTGLSLVTETRQRERQPSVHTTACR